MTESFANRIFAKTLKPRISPKMEKTSLSFARTFGTFAKIVLLTEGQAVSWGILDCAILLHLLWYMMDHEYFINRHEQILFIHVPHKISFSGVLCARSRTTSMRWLDKNPISLQIVICASHVTGQYNRTISLIIIIYYVAGEPQTIHVLMNYLCTVILKSVMVFA